MKISVDLPVANAEGKTIALELDTGSGEIAVTTPVMLRTPRILLADLRRAVREIEAAADSPEVPGA